MFYQKVSVVHMYMHVEEEKKKQGKQNFLFLIFITLRNISETLGVVKGFVCEFFVSLCSGYHGAFPVPYVQYMYTTPFKPVPSPPKKHHCNS